jgi:hypothetical protein
MGVAQHHDAVSGTEKQEVVFDYAQRLSNGIDVASVSIQIISYPNQNSKQKLINLCIILVLSNKFNYYHSKACVDFASLQSNDRNNHNKSPYCFF